MTLNVGTNTLTLAEDGKSLASKVAVGACATGSGADDTTCQKVQTGLK